MIKFKRLDQGAKTQGMKPKARARRDELSSPPLDRCTLQTKIQLKGGPKYRGSCDRGMLRERGNRGKVGDENGLKTDSTITMVASFVISYSHGLHNF